MPPEMVDEMAEWASLFQLVGYLETGSRDIIDLIIYI